MNDLSPALFLDRDGVIHKEIGYLFKPEQVQFLPGIFDLCRAAVGLGYKIIIITNQSGIARGLYSEADFHALMSWMMKQFARHQINVTAYYYCPHHPEHGIGPYRKECADRKPQPGMLLHASRDHNIEMKRSVFVGDRCSDMEAGNAAGVGKLVLLTTPGSENCDCGVIHLIVSSLREVTAMLTA